MCPPFARTQALIMSFVPLINSHVDSRLFKTAPNFNQPLLQFVDGVDFPLVYTTLHESPDLVINWIEIWTVWRSQIWRNEVWCFSTQNLHSFKRTFTLVLVLQGNVATKLSYGGKCFILVMSHFFLIPTLKEFKNSTNICQSYSKNKSGPVFLTHSVYANHTAQFSVAWCCVKILPLTHSSGKTFLIFCATL